ncbi:MAG TPA: hypothetical protein VF608_07245, partial [Thermoanaerobaculia bacterium]
MSRASLANANARTHAAKARLLTRAEAAPLFSATDDIAMQRVVAALGVADPTRSVLRIYQTAIRGYPRGEPLFRALLARHEIEDVKVSWRRSRHGGITPLQIVEQLAATPYAAIAATVARAHGTDIAAAELAFDRWVSQRLLDEARRLPRREVLARRLVESVVRER